MGQQHDEASLLKPLVLLGVSSLSAYVRGGGVGAGIELCILKLHMPVAVLVKLLHRRPRLRLLRSPILLLVASSCCCSNMSEIDSNQLSPQCLYGRVLLHGYWS